VTATAAGEARIPILGSFESVFQPQHDVDNTESTGHATRWCEDLQLLKDCGVSTLRYPVRWHRVEAVEGEYDWTTTDRTLGWMRANDMHPIVDLVHHMSVPLWLSRGFADPRYHDAALRYYEAVARRYPWLEAYTLFNEPFTTLFLAGSEAIFPPHLRGMEGFMQLLRNVLPTINEGSLMCRDLLPGARHVNVDTCERHSAALPEGEEYAAYANDRRFALTDLIMGVDLDADRPFLRELLANGGEDILAIPPGRIDVLGLDYYAHSQWQFTAPGVGAGTSPNPGRLDDLIVEYWERYQVPVILGETNIRGHASDRASWFKYTLEQCENAAGRGVPVQGHCWFPFIDSCDWASLLRRADGAIDPVGVYWLDTDLTRRRSSMSESFRLAAAGVPAGALPAYRFRRPVADWVSGYLPQMAHWTWLDAPDEPVCTNAPQPEDVIEFPALPTAAEPVPGAAYEE
jgi:beta-glucosidase/6-phospho-beta-glucosidase/beta-galactosidase